MEDTPIMLYNVPTDHPCPKCGEKLWERNKHRFPYPVEEYCPRRHYRKEIPDFTSPVTAVKSVNGEKQ
jgi:hypothetical protein